MENKYRNDILKLESNYKEKLQEQESLINDLKNKITNQLQLPNELSNESVEDNTTPISDLDTNDVDDENNVESPLFPSTPVLDLDTLPDNINKLKEIISDYATKLRKSEIKYDEFELKYQSLLSETEEDDSKEKIKKLEKIIEQLQQEQTKISHTKKKNQNKVYIK